jgi:DapF: diaminopimelate epimerase
MGKSTIWQEYLMGNPHVS